MWYAARQSCSSDPQTSAPGSPTVKPVTTVEADGVKRHYVKTLRLTSDQLKLLNLKSGVNNISYTVPAYTGIAKCTARIFLWEADYQVVISDVRERSSETS